MTHKYDGYHFRDNTPGMFNPFSVLNCLHSRHFDDYWFQTGTPTFLVKPNEEVRYGFINFITPFYTSVTEDESGSVFESSISQL